jgi:hypothetical protein
MYAKRSKVFLPFLVHKNVFGWKSVQQNYDLNSMWFFLLKLVKISRDPFAELTELLENVIRLQNPYLYITLFELVMFIACYVPKFSESAEMQQIFREKFTKYARKYTTEVQTLFQTSSPVLSSQLWKEGFVEIFQYFFCLQKDLGWDIVKELYEPFIRIDPGMLFGNF